MNMDRVWTPEVCESLRKMWDEGLTTGPIARRLGVTRNAVIGKAHRLGLAPRPSPLFSGSPSRRAKPKKRAARGEPYRGSDWSDDPEEMERQIAAIVGKIR